MNVVIRLGGFHIAQNFMGCIGFYMKNSGIEEILAESEVCKRGTANKVIDGKDYYKMVRCHSLVSEAMSGLIWSTFEGWLESEDQLDLLEDLSDHLNILLDALETTDSQAANSHIKDVKVDLKGLLPMWIDFVETLGVTANFWLMYIEMVQVLKRYIHAERAGLWQEHIQEVQNMLPFIVSAQHMTNMTCLPLYLNNIRALLDEHPYVYENFMKGHFTVHRRQGNFNGVWTYGPGANL